MTSKTNQINNYFRFILLAVILIFLFREVLIYEPILKYSPTLYEKAIIINDKNTMRRGHITGAFTYSYEFCYKSECYKNDSKREFYKIGDTVLVEYNEIFPFMNRIKKNPWTREEYLRMYGNEPNTEF